MLINHISSMTCSVISVANVDLLLVKYNPVFWVYPHATRLSLNQPIIFFLKTNFELIMRLLLIPTYFRVTRVGNTDNIQTAAAGQTGRTPKTIY